MNQVSNCRLMKKKHNDQLYLQDYADCSLEVQCGTYTDVTFEVSGLTSSVSQDDFTLSTEDVSSLTSDISCKFPKCLQFFKMLKYHFEIFTACCSGINTDNAVELKSSCLGDRIQTTLVTTYTPNGDTLNDRNVYTDGSSILFYSSTIEVNIFIIDINFIGRNIKFLN